MILAVIPAHDLTKHRTTGDKEMNMNPDQTQEIKRKPGRPRKEAIEDMRRTVEVITTLRVVPPLIAPCCGTGVQPIVQRWRRPNAAGVQVADCICPRCSPPNNRFIYCPSYMDDYEHWLPATVRVRWT